MMFNYQTSLSAAEALEMAAARIGLSPKQLVDLLESGLEIDHLVDYIDAVVSHRMN
jgi:hypothetical protein